MQCHSSEYTRHEGVHHGTYICHSPSEVRYPCCRLERIAKCILELLQPVSALAANSLFCSSHSALSELIGIRVAGAQLISQLTQPSCVHDSAQRC